MSAADISSPENRKLLAIMKEHHPDMPEFILENCIRFYRAGIIDDLARTNPKKKRGRPFKKLPVAENIVGAVDIIAPEKPLEQV